MSGPSRPSPSASAKTPKQRARRRPPRRKPLRHRPPRARALLPRRRRRPRRTRLAPRRARRRPLRPRLPRPLPTRAPTRHRRPLRPRRRRTLRRLRAAPRTRRSRRPGAPASLRARPAALGAALPSGRGRRDAQRAIFAAPTPFDAPRRCAAVATASCGRRRASRPLRRSTARSRGCVADRVDSCPPAIRWRRRCTSTRSSRSSTTCSTTSTAPRMAHSLEVRVPFLDHHLVEYCSHRPHQPQGPTASRTKLRPQRRSPRHPPRPSHRQAEDRLLQHLARSRGSSVRRATLAGHASLGRRRARRVARRTCRRRPRVRARARRLSGESLLPSLILELWLATKPPASRPSLARSALAMCGICGVVQVGGVPREVVEPWRVGRDDGRDDASRAG